jgi:hypothetical protein
VVQVVDADMVAAILCERAKWVGGPRSGYRTLYAGPGTTDNPFARVHAVEVERLGHVR